MDEPAKEDNADGEEAVDKPTDDDNCTAIWQCDNHKRGCQAPGAAAAAEEAHWEDDADWEDGAVDGVGPDLDNADVDAPGGDADAAGEAYWEDDAVHDGGPEWDNRASGDAADDDEGSADDARGKELADDGRWPLTMKEAPHRSASPQRGGVRTDGAHDASRL